MKKDYLLFDLDGTISDPKEGMAKSVQYSLQALGIQLDDTDSLTRFIGPPIRDSYRNLFGLNSEETEIAVTLYREYFSKTGIFENILYEGIEVMLKTLKEMGKTLILATSKATVYAERILVHFEIDSFFSFVAGSELNGRRSKKSEVIRYALEKMNIVDLNKAIMIGDREHDIIGAKEVGMDSIGVLYGFGDLNELKSAGATFIAESVVSLSILLKE